MKRIYPILLIALLAACKGAVDGDIQYAFFKYAQTQCADRWKYGDTDQEMAANARHYLDSAGAFSITMDLRADGTPELCNSCACRTGKVFHAVTTENSAAQFMALGFTRERIP